MLYILVSLAVFVLCVALVEYWETKERWQKNDEKFEQWKLEISTAGDFNEIAGLFMAWRRARPFLYAGQCEYAQGLVLEMICLYRKILEMDLYEDDGFLQDLYCLLDERPPGSNPPRTQKPRIAGLSSLLLCFSVV